MEKPGVIVLTFQAPNLRVEIFFALFLGAQFTTRFSVFVLSPTHLMRLADCDGAAPIWLGAAHLEAGDSCPMEHNGSSHRQNVRSNPWRLALRQSSNRLITGHCCFSCFVRAVKRSWSDLSSCVLYVLGINTSW